MFNTMNPQPSPTLDSKAAYSLRLDRALSVAAIVHRAQKRKGTLVPYVMHPFHVAMILERHGYGETLKVAAVLHDVLEDVDPTDKEACTALRETFPALLGEAPEDPEAFAAALAEFVGQEFGPEVLALVQGVTEEKKDERGHTVPWGERKTRQMAHYRSPGVPEEVIALKAADVLHNARSITNDLRAHGLDTMRRFNGSAEDTLRYYGHLSEVVQARLGREHALAHELWHAVRDMAHTLDEQFGSAHERVRQALRQVTGGPA
jgi:(p)ppGpp synthase/HD superfamily hydrolase